MNFVLTGIGAGLVSALLTAVVAKATPLAAVLYLLSPIPVLIVSLGWNHRAGLIAAAVGSAAITAFLSPLSGLGFLIVTALPAWWLAYLALLGRADGEGVVEWYPIGRLLPWIAATATLTIVAAGVISSQGDYAAFHASARRVSEAFVDMRFQTGGADDLDAGLREEVIDWMAWLTPFLSAQGFTIALVVYLYTAGKIVSASKRLPRPWPDIAGLRMPKKVGLLLLLGLALAFLFPANFLAVVGLGLFGSLLTAFAFQGLARVHERTRGRSFRPAILIGLYIVLFVSQGALLVVLSLFGLIDTVFALPRPPGRDRIPPSTPMSS